jgi:hypothetical protein
MTIQSLSEAWQDAVLTIRRLVWGADRFCRTRVYGVGIGKSGTHSLAAMFSTPVRARHEPRALQLIDHVFDLKEGRISEPQMVAWLHRRDRLLGLEIDSAGLNYLILDLLLREFPDARFVLTIRDCYSWTDSAMNHLLRMTNADERWFRVVRYYYGREPVAYDPEERLLEASGIYPLDRYFADWKTRNEEVLAKVPSERLFVVRTDQLRQRASEIADFAGLPRSAIRVDRTHEYINPSKRSFLRELNRAFVERCADVFCRPLMTRYFPEIRSLDNAPR